ncbi:MAG: XF1762 family protein [Geminicoccaceae bacterium]
MRRRRVHARTRSCWPQTRRKLPAGFWRSGRPNELFPGSSIRGTQDREFRQNVFDLTTTTCKARDLRFDCISRRRFRACNRLWHSVLPHIGAINTLKVCYGAVHDGEVLAVAAVSNPVARELPQAEWLELRRLACGPAAPRNTPSRMLGWMAKDLRRRYPQVTRLISYHDHSHHAGTIYKAAGWTPVDTGGGGAWSNRQRFDRQAERRPHKTRWEIVLRT